MLHVQPCVYIMYILYIHVVACHYIHVHVYIYMYMYVHTHVQEFITNASTSIAITSFDVGHLLTDANLPAIHVYTCTYLHVGTCKIMLRKGTKWGNF